MDITASTPAIMSDGAEEAIETLKGVEAILSGLWALEDGGMRHANAAEALFVLERDVAAAREKLEAALGARSEEAGA